MTETDLKISVIAISGWKNSGKTTLTVRLVEELTRRGWRVATVKHAHHGFEIDGAESDSARHRRAGASAVAIVSPGRWAVVHELRDGSEPSLASLVARLSPADLVLAEGFKSAPVPKIEVRRRAQASQEPLADGDPSVIAIAADHAVDGKGLPVFSLDDVAAIADFVAASVGPRPGQKPE